MYNSQLIVNRIDALLSIRNTPKARLNEYCGISRNTFSQAKERPNGLSAKILYDTAEFLDCSIDYLLGRTDTVQTGGGTDLSEREAALIEMYRQLSPEERGYIFGKTETLAELHEKEYQQERA